jgi:hypothetical protein
MPLRIIAAAVGGLLGFAIWYIVVVSLGLTSVATQAMYSQGGTLDDPLAGRRNSRILVYFFGSMGLCVIGGGALAQLAGEKLGLIPSQERVNQNERPPSILSRNDDY